MARIEPVFMTKGTGGFADGIQAPVVGLIEGGNFGYAKQWAAWINNTPYTSRPLISFLLEAPLGFKLLPEGKTHIAILRSLVETIRHRINGLGHKLTVSTDQNQAFGGSGQKYEVFTNVTEDQLNVTMSFWERPGLAIGRYMRYWIEMLMMNMETKYASISTVAGTADYDAMPDMYSMSMLFIEPNATMTKVVQSWIGINMWPKTSGDNEAKHDKENPSETRELQIEFSGIYHYGPGVDFFAQKFLDSIKLVNANAYHEAAVHNNIGLDSLVAASRMSFGETVRNISRNQFK